MNHVWFGRCQMSKAGAQCLSMPIRRITNFGGLRSAFLLISGHQRQSRRWCALRLCYFSFFYGSRRKGGRKAGLSCSEMKGAEWATGAEWQQSEERTGAGRIDQVHFCRRSSLGGRQRRGGGGGERTGMFMFPVANRSRGWQPSRIRRWPARNVPSVSAAGSIGSSHRLRCTTYEFLTWTTRVTWCTMDVNGTRVVASRVCRAETLHFATFVGCVCTDRLWR